METTNKDGDKWNQIYRQSSHRFPSPCSVLKDGGYLLPPDGRALDIACGLGGNALFLASAGLEVVAIDISEVALSKLREHAAAEGLSVHTIAEAADLHFFSGGGVGQFDVITVSNYLDRDLFKILPDLLRNRGLLYYQTFVNCKADPQVGPSSPEFLLDTNELLKLTSGLDCRVFYDLGITGQLEKGLRNQSCIIAQKES